MLNNPFGVLLYILLRNDISWSLLPAEEKKIILEANRNHNITRGDYASPEKYAMGRRKGGENWDSFGMEDIGHRGETLFQILEQNKPRKVLEVGSGAGFYSKMICQYHTVEHYTGADIGRAFLDYLQPRLEQMKEQRKFSFNLICGNGAEMALTGEYDLIVLLSAVHHIPNRVDLFNNLNNALSKNGLIFCFEPSHYIPRICNILKKCIFDGYLKKEYYLNRNNLSTHHSCSCEEFKKIVREIPDLKIEEFFYKLPRKVKRYNRLFVPNRWFSTEIGVTLKKM